MTKHTPGPYLREGTFVYALTENTGGMRSRKNAPLVNRFTAQVYGGGRDGAPIEELEAVARLFEAAPEMYEALEAVLDNDRAVAILDRYAPGLLTSLGAALAKARGESI